jgi:hypothetical protein
MLTVPVGVACIFGALVMVIAVFRIMEALPIVWLAVVECARVLVVAFWSVNALPCLLVTCI